MNQPKTIAQLTQEGKDRLQAECYMTGLRLRAERRVAADPLELARVLERRKKIVVDTAELSAIDSVHTVTR